MDDQEKTEQATPRKRQQAWEKGQTGQSQDLISALVLLTTLFLLRQMGMKLGQALSLWTQMVYAEPWLKTDHQTLTDFLSRSTFSFLSSLSIYIVLLLMVGIGGHLLQSGWHFLPEKIRPDWERISLYRGWKRLFSVDGLIRTSNGLLKIIFCLLGLWWSITSHWEMIGELGSLSPMEISIFLFDILTKTAITIGFLLFALALGDLLWQRWKLSQEIKMTIQEIKEEMKETMGDPLVIQKQRELLHTLTQREQNDNAK